MVANEAKSNHVAANSLSAGEAVAHDDPRFYTRSGKLVNSIHGQKMTVTLNSIEGHVVAGERYATKIEVGSPNSRAFPFLGPALETKADACIATLARAIKKVIK
jgi:hypothetical protein